MSDRRVRKLPRRLPLLVPMAVALAAGAQAPDEPLPELGLSLRGVTDGAVEQGEPMRIAVLIQLDAGEGNDGALELAPATGTWADAIGIEVVDAAGRSTGVRADPVGSPDSPTAQLDPGRFAGGLWRIAPNATSTLAPGSYLLRARLAIDAAAPGSGGWTGAVLAEDLPLEIVAPASGPESPAQAALALAQDALIDGRVEEAASILDELLLERRDEIRGWVLRAAVSERAGNPFGALRAIREARLLYDALEPREPLVDLESIAGRVTDELGAFDATQIDTLPAWSWPPAALLTASSLPQPPAGSPPTADAAAQAAATPNAAAPASATSDVAAQAAVTAAASAAAPVEQATVLPFASLDDTTIRADARGQWASTATASSEYANDRYSAVRATGAPDVDTYSDNPNAWCHSGRSVPEEWLELGFATPVIATELRVRQSYTPGTLARVEAFAADGRPLVLWEGADPNDYPAGQIVWFGLRFPPTPFPVVRVRLTLNIAAKNGWKQIDAVQLIGQAP